jgi:DNA-binding response OmpR family regulator
MDRLSSVSAQTMRILVIEDESRMVDLLRRGLREHGYTVMTAQDGSDGLALAQEHPFDVIVLDLMLPGLNGWQVMRELRQSENPASVLMLTACDSEPEVIEGLESGADDYLTKPFSFSELLARLQCLARARSVQSRLMMYVDNLVLDIAHHRAFRGNQRLDLTRTELTLLVCLMKQQGSVVSRSALLRLIWGEDPSVGRSALDSFISLLRKKVDLPGQSKLVHTVKGIGYSLHLEAEFPSALTGART